jgi:hypothetical protein
MSSGEVTNIVIGVAVVALLLARQMQTRRARERSSARIILILAVIGVFDISDATKGHTLGAGAVAWLIGSLLVGAALGAARAVTVVIWRAPDGTAWRKGTVLTATLWLVSLGVHFALEVGINSSTKIAALGASSILLYLAVTYGVQLELVRWRAAKLAPTAS